MKRENYEEQLEYHDKKEFKRLTDALYDASYLLGMLAKESRFEGDDEIHEKLIKLAAHYSCEIEEEIRKGRYAQEKLNKMKGAIIYEGKS